jgi:hypothetical protein
MATPPARPPRASSERDRKPAPAARVIAERWRRLAPRIGLVLLCLLAYHSNDRLLPLEMGGDTIPNRLLPLSLLHFGTPTLDPFGELLEPTPWYLLEREGHLLSLYPIGTPLLAVPIYAPFSAFFALNGTVSPSELLARSALLEKVAASLLTTLAVLLCYLALRRVVEARGAFWIALALGLGTSLWATASQMLWQHAGVALALAAALYFLTGQGSPAWAAGAGAALAVAVAVRPTAGIFLAAGLVVVATRRLPARERLAQVGAYLLAAVPLIAALVAFNLAWYDHPVGGYGALGSPFDPRRAVAGLAGLTFSPNRGLLVFTPVALFGIWGALAGSRRWVRERGDWLLPAFAAGALLHALVVGSYRDWPGGRSFGPRLLVDVLPVIAFAAAPLWPHLGRAGRTVAAVLLAWSIAVQWNGAFCYPASRWHMRMEATGEPLTKHAWSWRHFALLEDWRAWHRLGGGAAQFTPDPSMVPRAPRR